MGPSQSVGPKPNKLVLRSNAGYQKSMRERSCTKCGVVGGSLEFSQNGTHPTGEPRLRSVCRACEAAKSNDQPKRCSVCKKKKPATEFRQNGTYAACKPCQNEKVAAAKRPGGSQHRRHVEAQGRYQKEKWRTDPEYRERVRARQAVYWAVKTGTLKRPAKCSACPRRCTPHAHHHHGYAREHWLDVTWFCAKCHYQIEHQETK